MRKMKKKGGTIEGPLKTEMLPRDHTEIVKEKAGREGLTEIETENLVAEEVEIMIGVILK
jgi:hypothetical protein